MDPHTQATDRGASRSSRPSPTPTAPASPTDPVLAAVSDRWGGPAGRRLRSPDRRGARGGRRRRFWSVPRILVALTALAVLLSALTSQYCRINGWGGPGVYHAGCYSDVAALYTQRGLGEEPWAPFLSGEWFEYPVLTGLLASLAAVITGGLDELFAGTALQYWEGGRTLLYWDVTFLLGAMAWFLLVLTVMQAAGRRPWDAAIVAVSPAVILAAGINWDLWASAALALAILAYLRGAHLVAGVLIGIGVSFKLFPLFMLGAVFVVALRTRLRGGAEQGTEGHDADQLVSSGGADAGHRVRRTARRDSGPMSGTAVVDPVVGLAEFGRTAAGAAGSWLLLNLPAVLISPEAWAQFFTYSAERGAGYSSVWHIWQVLAEAEGGAGPSAETVSLASFLLFAAACAGVLVLGLMCPHRPRMVQLLLLIVGAFLLVNKVYSPQFMIWLVPLIALAAPRWRDVLIWTGLQVLHFWAIWMFLAGVVGDQEPQHTMPDGVYVLAVLGHMGATAYVMSQVILDMWRPERDVVRTPPWLRGPAAAGGGIRLEEDASAPVSR